MGNFLKHVGLFNAQKIVIVLHQLPSEEHMCLLLVQDKLPPHYAEFVKNALNSAAGQEAKDSASILETVKLPDGRNLGFVLHSEGHFKKAPTNQVFVTPDSRNKLRLSELNANLQKIAEGGEALEKLKAMDEGAGLYQRPVPTSTQETADELRAHSEKLKEAAEKLLAEAKVLSEKADSLPKPKKPRAAKVA